MLYDPNWRKNNGRPADRQYNRPWKAFGVVCLLVVFRGAVELGDAQSLHTEKILYAASTPAKP